MSVSSGTVATRALGCHRLESLKIESGRYFFRMSTLTEIEAAAEALPRAEQEVLYAHLGARLGNAAESCPPRLAALEALQASLALDEHKSREWQTATREARR